MKFFRTLVFIFGFASLFSLENADSQLVYRVSFDSMSERRLRIIGPNTNFLSERVTRQEEKDAGVDLDLLATQIEDALNYMLVEMSDLKFLGTKNWSSQMRSSKIGTELKHFPKVFYIKVLREGPDFVLKVLGPNQFVLRSSPILNDLMSAKSKIIGTDDIDMLAGKLEEALNGSLLGIEDMIPLTSGGWPEILNNSNFWMRLLPLPRRTYTACLTSGSILKIIGPEGVIALPEIPSDYFTSKSPEEKIDFYVVAAKLEDGLRKRALLWIDLANWYQKDWYLHFTESPEWKRLEDYFRLQDCSVPLLHLGWNH